MKLFGYIRVSQCREDDKLSPVIQEEQIRRHAQKMGAEIVDIISDLDIRGSTFDRPGWKELTRRLDEVDGILVVCLDRFGRNLGECLKWTKYLQDHDKQIISVMEDVDLGTVGGRIHYKTLLYVHDIFLEIHRQRMKDVQTTKKVNGEWRGGTLPLGYEQGEDGKVRVNEYEAGIVLRIFALRDSGHTFASIANTLNEEGFSGSKGGKWTTTSVNNVLKNASYISKRRVEGELVPVDIPQLIEEEVWRRVQPKVIDKTANGSYLLSGLLRCGKCGATLNRRKGYGPHHGKADWVCGALLRGNGCKGVTIRENVAEEAVVEKIGGQWASWSPERKKKTIRQYIDSVIVNEKHKGQERLEFVIKEESC